MRKNFIVTVLCFGILFFGALFAPAAKAATLTVTKVADTNDGACNSDCSLREAIAAAAASGDTIEFASPLFDSAQTIALNSELSVAGKTITITGRAANLTAVSGSNQTRVFNVAAGGNLTLNDLTITGGRDASAGGGIYNAGTLKITNGAVSDNALSGGGSLSGGGIYNADFATLTITDSTISGNTMTGGNDNYGGGIYSGSIGALTITGSTISGNSISGGGNFSNRGGGIANNNGTLTIKNSTVSGNSALGGTNNRGGGIYSQFRDLTIIGVTITGNSAGGSGFSYGGGLFTQQDTVTLTNSIISGNSAPNNPNLFGSLSTSNFNLIDGDARLAPLGFYGGTTQTHALLPDSPAINTGNPVYDPSTHGANDQRGGLRVIGGRIDIGAFENNIDLDQSSLPNGSRSQFYSQTLSATRMTGLAENSDYLNANSQQLVPFTFSIVPVAGQSLPPGLTLSSSGLLSGTPTVPGAYNFTVMATDVDGYAGVNSYLVNIFAPTAANVSVSGKVLTQSGQAVSRVLVLMTDSRGVIRTAQTNTFGNYRFENVRAGETYVMQISSRRYQSVPQVVPVSNDIAELNLIVTE